MNQSGRTKLAVAVAAVAVAVSTAGAGDRGAVAAAAEPAKEKVCTTTETFNNMGSGKKVNISLCAETDGLSVKVTGAADCFYAYGAGKFDDCKVTGTWSVYKPGDKNHPPVSTPTRDLGESAPYLGAGAFTLEATVSARGEESGASGNSGTTAVVGGNGHMERTVTFKTPATPRPNLWVMPPKFADKAADGSRQVQLFNDGNRAADHAFLGTVSDKPLTDDKRCTTNEKWFPGMVMTRCALGTLKPGEKATVVLNKQPNAKAANPFAAWNSGPKWSYGAENFPAQQDG